MNAARPPEGGPDQHQDQDTTVVARATSPGLCEEHRNFLAKHAVDPELAERDGVRCVHKPEELPEEAPASWSSYLPTILFRYEHDGLAEWPLAIPAGTRR